TSRLRVVVSVPELEVAGIKLGNKLAFSVPAYPGRMFEGTVARIGHALDVETRTMPVELDVENRKEELEPGMYATVHWDNVRPFSSLFVPTSAVGVNLEKTFVVRVKGGLADPVNVKTGKTMDGKIEVVGPIQSGDLVALKASEDLKTGKKVNSKI